MDELFFKVIRNKFLLNFIFQVNRDQDWIPTNNVKGYNFKNKKKFNDINDLKWFIENDEYKLLNFKLKIENNNLKIDSESLKSLFNEKSLYNHYKIKKNNFTKRYCSRYQGYYKDGDEIKYKNQFLKDLKELEKDRKESLSLILQLKSNQLIQDFNLFSILFESKNYWKKKYKPNLQLAFIFTSEPFNLSINKDLIQELFIDTNNKYKEIIIDFILENKNMVQDDNHDDDHDDQEINLGGSCEIEKKKVIKEISINEYDFLTINNKNLQIKILESGFISIVSNDSLKFNNDIIDIGERIQEIHKQYIQYLVDSKDFQDDEKILKIYKHYLKKYDTVPKIENIITTKFYYRNNHIDKIDAVIFKYTFGYLSLKGLKYLSNSTFTRNKLSEINKQVKLKKRNLPLSNDFIAVYTTSSVYELFYNYSTDTEIFKYMNLLSINDDGNNNYKNAMFSIFFNDNIYCNLFNNLPKSLWCGLNSFKTPLPFKFMVKDKESIDWISNNNEIITKLHFEQYKSEPIINYQTIELMEYAKETANEIKILNSGPIYSNIYSCAINNCDIEKLKYLDSNYDYKIKSFEKIIGDGRTSDDDKIIKKSIKKMKHSQRLKVIQKHGNKINFQNQTISNIIKLVNYLNSTNFKLFSPSLFKEFIKCLIYSDSFNDGTNLDLLNQLKDIIISFNQFKIETIQLYIESITGIKSPKTIEFILNSGFKPITRGGSKIENNTLNSSFIQYWNNESKDRKDGSFIFFYHGHSSDFDRYPLNQSCLYYLGDDSEPNHCTSAESLYDIIDCIKLTLSQFNKLMISAKDQYNGGVVSNTFENIINHLFKRLIKVGSVSSYMVENVYNLIITSWGNSSSIQAFKFEHSIYHSYFYLSIKSLKITKFILELNSSYFVNGKSDFDIETVGYENQDNFLKFKSETPNPLKYLDPNVYTYEFIFNSTTSNLLDSVIDHLMIKPSLNPNSKWGFNANPYLDDVESLLLHLMQVKEIDLFFKYLELIENQLSDIDISIGKFPLIGDNVNDIGDDCKIIDFYKDLKPVINDRYIYFSTELIDSAITNLNFDQFFRFCKFCCYYSIKYISIEYIDQPTNGKNFELLKQIVNYFEGKNNN